MSFLFFLEKMCNKNPLCILPRQPYPKVANSPNFPSSFMSAFHIIEHLLAVLKMFQKKETAARLGQGCFMSSRRHICFGFLDLFQNLSSSFLDNNNHTWHIEASKFQSSLGQLSSCLQTTMANLSFGGLH